MSSKVWNSRLAWFLKLIFLIMKRTSLSLIGMISFAMINPIFEWLEIWHLFGIELIFMDETKLLPMRVFKNKRILISSTFKISVMLQLLSWRLYLRFLIFNCILEKLIWKASIHNWSTSQRITRALLVSYSLLCFKNALWITINAWSCHEIYIATRLLIELLLCIVKVTSLNESIVRTSNLGICYQITIIKDWRWRIFMLNHVFHFLNTFHHYLIRVLQLLSIKYIWIF